jgi:hypothetical protein
MATNTELVTVIIASQSREALEQAAMNLAQRLDIIANMKSESPVGQLQLITEARFFHPQTEADDPKGYFPNKQRLR